MCLETRMSDHRVFITSRSDKVYYENTYQKKNFDVLYTNLILRKTNSHVYLKNLLVLDNPVPMKHKIVLVKDYICGHLKCLGLFVLCCWFCFWFFVVVGFLGGFLFFGFGFSKRFLCVALAVPELTL